MSFGTKLENKSAPAGFFYLYKWQQMLLNKKVEGQISAASVGKASGKGFFHVERIPKNSSRAFCNLCRQVTEK